MVDTVAEGRNCPRSCRVCRKEFADSDQLVVHLGLGHGLLHQLLPDEAKIAALFMKVANPTTAKRPLPSRPEKAEPGQNANNASTAGLIKLSMLGQKWNTLAASITAMPGLPLSVDVVSQFKKISPVVAAQLTSPQPAVVAAAEAVNSPPTAEGNVCFQCGYVAQPRARRESYRWVMYSHYVRHYRHLLAPYIRNNQTCGLCEKQGGNLGLIERHIALHHDVMDKLLPEQYRIPKGATRKKRRPKVSRRKSDLATNKMSCTPPPAASSEPIRTNPVPLVKPAQLTCPLCKVVLFEHCLPHRRRDYLYQHFIVHYRSELRAYTEDYKCRLCGREQKPRNLLRHVGMVHGVLDTLLPPEVAAAERRIKRRQERARQMGVSCRMEEDEDDDLVGESESEIKMELEEHFQVQMPL